MVELVTIYVSPRPMKAVKVAPTDSMYSRINGGQPIHPRRFSIDGSGTTIAFGIPESPGDIFLARNGEDNRDDLMGDKYSNGGSVSDDAAIARRLGGL